MTGPVVPPGGEELRRALAVWNWDRSGEPDVLSYEMADELLALVRPSIEEQGRRRAADELRAAADELDSWTPDEPDARAAVAEAADDLRARAAALAPENARPE